MNKTNVITLLCVLCVLIGAAAVTYYLYVTPNDAANSDARRTLGLSEGQSFTDLQGTDISLEEHEGKVRVVNSWASWTPFSAQELKDLETLAAAHANEGVVVIAINRDEPKEQAQQFLSTLGTFEHIQFILDGSDTFYDSVEGYAMPETLFYDARGNIYHHKRGNMTKEEMERLLMETIAASNE